MDWEEIPDLVRLSFLQPKPPQIKSPTEMLQTRDAKTPELNGSCDLGPCDETMLTSNLFLTFPKETTSTFIYGFQSPRRKM